VDALPETAWNAELGARAYPSYAWGATYAEVTGFGSRYDNLVGQCTLSAGCAEADLDRPFSGGTALVAGVEATLAQDVTLPRGRSLRAEGAWTWTRAAFAASFESEFPQWGDVRAGDALPYVPTQQGSASVTLRGPRGAVGGSVSHRGGMRDVAGSGEVDPRASVPSATVVDLHAEWGIPGRGEAPGAKVYAVARNALDTVTYESLRPFGVRPGAPRTVIVGVKVTPTGP
jgi:Fe(3+) dicitrate transport protein